MFRPEAIQKALESIQMNEDPELAALERAGTTPAPPEHTWVCGACGKTSRTRYGFDAQNHRVAQHGWDESCMLNAVLCYTQRTADGKWQAVGS